MTRVSHRVAFRVYYEDTDCLGVVYYANYFRFLERGRSEFLAAAGTSVAQLNEDGVIVVVHSLQANFRKPARLGDLLDVVSTFTAKSPFRGRFGQRIEREGELIVEATVDVVCLNPDQRLIELPVHLRVLADA